MRSQAIEHRHTHADGKTHRNDRERQERQRTEEREETVHRRPDHDGEVTGKADLAGKPLAVDLGANALHRGIGVLEREAERGAGDIRAEQRVRLAAHGDRAADALEPLRDVDLRFPSALVAQRPAAGDVGGHDPEERFAASLHDGLVGLPLAHVPLVRHDARARLHRKKLRTKLMVELGQKVQRHDRRLREVLLEDVARDDRDLVRHARPGGVAAGERRHGGVVLDAHRSRAELCSRNREAAFAGAQVVHEVGLVDLRRPRASA